MSELDKKILIHGKNLKADNVTVKIEDTPFTLADKDKISDDLIQLELPPEFPAGKKPLKVRHSVILGTNPTKYDLFESNALILERNPEITSIVPQPVTKGDDVTVNFIPPLYKQQKASIILNDKNNTNNYNIDMDVTIPGNIGVNSILFNTQNIEIGKYIIRLKIDGSSSILKVDEDNDGSFFDFAESIGQILEVA